MTDLTNRFVVGYDLYVVEKRHPDGTLDFSPPQPPFMEATVNELCDHFFARTESIESASQEAIAAWYASQGFYYRPKTW